MGRVFVISDVHGYQEAFFALLAQAQFNEQDQLYLLGDVVDRGPDGVSLLQYLMNQPNMQLLLGNHEELMLRALKDEWGWFEVWIQNGGASTYAAFNALAPQEQRSLLDFLEERPLYQLLSLEQGDFLLVHAGIRPLPEGDVEQQLNVQTRDDLLWIREAFLRQSLAHLPFTVVHGHTPTPHYPRIQAISPATRGISIEPGRIGIDCGAGLGVQLGLYCLTDGRCYYQPISQ